MAVKIALCAITKGDSELPLLKKMIDSVREVRFDGIFITANGQEVSKTREYCKKNDLNYSFFEWCDDFSAVRNFNFSQAPDGFDYIFWLDTDDLLVGADKLRAIAEKGVDMGMDIIFLDYWYGCEFSDEPSLKSYVRTTMEHPRERLIRPNTNIWKKRLHETPVPINGVNLKYTKLPYKEFEVAVMHTSEDEVLPAKMLRNKKLLELDLEDERKLGEADPRTLLYLMKIYNELDDTELYKTAIEFGKEYIEKSGWDMERGVAWDIMAQCVARLGDIRTGLLWLFNSIREYPKEPMIYLRIASFYYNLKNYDLSKFWLERALEMPLDKNGLVNYKGMKAMAAELMVKLNWNAKKNVKEAYEAAKLLYSEVPTKSNEDLLAFIADAYDLDVACEKVDKLLEYLDSIGDSKTIKEILSDLPQAITGQPFAIKWYHKVNEPKIWADNEICYFANFGRPHFEKWDESSLETGIGGSETAVIRLAQEWVKKGFKVTVYGDPITIGERDGIKWLPWYYFNNEDTFSTFIQWRDWSLAGKVKCTKFLVDLHDIYAGIDIKPEHLEHISKFMVKSDYHRRLAPHIKDDFFAVISNGIDL